MSNLHFTTKHANEATVKRNWYVVDGTNQTVGRMCAKIAAILRGKNKAYYTPHVDCGDYIIVINAEKVVFTGNKLEDKMYQNFSGYPGGLREEKAGNLQKRRPEMIVERAVKGMLPKIVWAVRCLKNCWQNSSLKGKSQNFLPGLLQWATSMVP